MPNGLTYVVGDVHGHLDKLIRLLQRIDLVTGEGTWAGGAATLWLSGDLTDRGPHGLGAIEFAMCLQQQATAAGGRVDALVGNHDALLVAARRFGGSFLANWRRNGGIANDLRGLTPRHVDWLISRPAMMRVGDHLLVHADTPSYRAYGHTIDEVNRTIQDVMSGTDKEAWDTLIEVLSERHGFDWTAAGGTQRAIAMLRRFDVRRLVHGHTPISRLLNILPFEVRAPLVYANGRCVNVDGGLYLGGAGVIYRVEPVTLSR